LSNRWTFTPSVDDAWREPPLSDPRQLPPLRELLPEIGYDRVDLDRFLGEDWPDLLARAGDPEAEYFGNGISFRISGDEVIFTPLYDQWADAAFVYIPLADVQDLIDQYAAYIRHRDREERSS
jgi:hypothetical protein